LDARLREERRRALARARVPRTGRWIAAVLGEEAQRRGGASYRCLQPLERRRRGLEGGLRFTALRLGGADRVLERWALERRRRRGCSAWRRRARAGAVLGGLGGGGRQSFGIVALARLGHFFCRWILAEARGIFRHRSLRLDVSAHGTRPGLGRLFFLGA